MNQFSRSELIFGKDGIERLSRARVAVFGIGGVGGYTVEALARGGIGALDLIDSDTVNLTNLNRQIIATHKTIGMYKVDAAENRIHEINPGIKVKTYKVFYTQDTKALFDFSCYDYVVDAIDTVAGKIALAEQAQEAGTRIISCMGAGNKVDATMLEVADIYKTSVCPLARAVRKILKERGIKKLKVVYSKEIPVKTSPTEETKGTSGNPVPGSTSFVPSAAGLIIAGEIIKELSGFNTLRNKP
ncbi:tRNA threonylcarbamoyladenosine dehydratase [Treponema sp.]|uniref:tRNA threonylcarbamoyladenosine dehydratase n=1 Tax=Treponema sp. TaxID=166 RepID=UPI003F0F1704